MVMVRSKVGLVAMQHHSYVTMHPFVCSYKKDTLARYGLQLLVFVIEDHSVASIMVY